MMNSKTGALPQHALLTERRLLRRLALWDWLFAVFVLLVAGYTQFGFARGRMADVLKAHYAELEVLALREFVYTRDESIRKYRALKQAA